MDLSWIETHSLKSVFAHLKPAKVDTLFGVLRPLLGHTTKAGIFDTSAYTQEQKLLVILLLIGYNDTVYTAACRRARSWATVVRRDYVERYRILDMDGHELVRCCHQLALLDRTTCRLLCDYEHPEVVPQGT